ncbi:hypothetical protein StrepF001_25740 [Streptomyces sp. F001]|nr:hypothetical protein StrepF001_25740 [Streptomyces sp. F001]
MCGSFSALREHTEQRTTSDSVPLAGTRSCGRAGSSAIPIRVPAEVSSPLSLLCGTSALFLITSSSARRIAVDRRAGHPWQQGLLVLVRFRNL